MHRPTFGTADCLLRHLLVYKVVKMQSTFVYVISALNCYRALECSIFYRVMYSVAHQTGGKVC